MPDNNTAETPQDTRDPAVSLLEKFLKENNIVIIADEKNIVNKDANELLYTVNKTIRIQAYYKDQIENKEKSNGKVEI